MNEMLESEFWSVKPGKEEKPFDRAEVYLQLSTRQKDATFDAIIDRVEATGSPKLHTLVRFFDILIQELS